MTVTTLLVLGFLLGMRHAMEADHVAAVATLASRSRNRSDAVAQGAIWGLGHTITLFVACSVVLFVDTLIPQRVAQSLNAVVGLMLIVLGLDLLRRMRRDRVHFHVHHHDEGAVHFHAHSHVGETRPHTSHHDHGHPRRFPLRALCVGMMHGLAGSAALILLALGTVTSPGMGLIYVGLFGLGSIGGMALLSLVISVPLRSAQRFTWLHNGLQAAVGLATIAIGSTLFYENMLFVRM